MNSIKPIIEPGDEAWTMELAVEEIQNLRKKNAALYKIINGFRRFNATMPFNITEYFDTETLHLYFEHCQK